MKKIFAFLVCSLVLCGFAFAKSPLAEFEKVREIKLLESKRKDVKRILAGFEHDKDDDEDYEQTFSNENAEIKVTFAKGDCSKDWEYWDVAEWVVTKVVIEPNDDIKVEDFKFDFSNFTKETEDEDSPENFEYQNEFFGIVFKIRNNEIESIYLFPSKSKLSSLCKNENTEEIITGERSFVDVLTQYVCILVNYPPTVDDVILDKNTIIADGIGTKEISVTTITTDKENDPLTYQYEITGGKIIGVGAKVVWDLTGVEPGNYTITVGANDGCGICTPTKTQTVVVRECDDCMKKKPQTDNENQTNDSKKP